jgi:hypothetical protein
MRKTALALAAAGTIALGAISVPQQAQAQWWVAPLIVGGLVVGGAAVATAATAPRAYQEFEPAGAIYVRPSGAPGSCRIMRERVPGGWRRVEVCY